jgi:hypothetical protein
MTNKDLRRTVLAALLLAAPSAGFSETIAVGPEMSARTDGVCSLTEAIDNANRDARTWPDCPGGSGADRLELTPGHAYTAALPWPGSQSALPPIRDDLEIIGFGATLMRDSTEAFRLIEVSNASVRIVGMMLEGGLSGSPSGGPAMVGGGAIFADQADLVLENSILRANRAAGLFTLGGAIRMDDSEVTILDSLLEGNSATSTASNAGGGAIAQFNGSLTIRRSALIDNFTDIPCNPSSPSSFRSNGGALRIEASADTGAQAYIYDSTIAGNRAVSGGGIHVAAIADTGVAGIEDVFVQLMRSTLVANEIGCPSLPGQGDGIRVQTLGGGEGLVAFGNSILHGNGRPLAGTINGVDCSANLPNASFVSLEGNVLDDDDTCPGGGFDAFASEIDQVIDTQRNFTHYLPLANGPAVDFFETGVNCPNGTEDQLGNPRAGGTGQGGSLCDAGAIELQASGLRFTLAVSLDGNGSGSVESLPAGVDCPGTCSADFDNGTAVELTAFPGPGDSFDGWSGACAGTAACTVTMDQARTVTARFVESTEFSLDVAILGGSATVTSLPAGIDCPGACSASFAAGTEVELLQVPDAGFGFDGWGGSCSGDGACVVTMSGPRSVAANYQALNTLNVNVSAGGSVTSVPSGIDCPDTSCAADFPPAEKVILQAEPDPDFTFFGWSGDCSGTGPCVVSMEQERFVVATFTGVPGEPALDVTIQGGGSVTSTPGGIDCPGTCSAEFPAGTDVTLTAIPASGFAFDSWAGDCSGDDACTISMDGPRAVSANFIATNPLEVTVNGPGAVTSTPAGIDCPASACSASFLPAAKVVLQAQPAPGANFVGWSGDCSGTGPCVVAMDQARSVSATFEQAGFELRVEFEGEGTGRVFELTAAGSIDCPGLCSAIYPPGTEVSLGITEGADSRFIGYRGDCQGGSCTVIMDQDRNVRAVFLSDEQLFLDSFEQ